MPSSFYLLSRDPVAGQSVTRLVPGQRVTLGRSPTNQIVVHDERASRMHAEIFSEDGGWAIRDLQSRNGTVVAGSAVTVDTRLTPGDVIAIGTTELLFCEGDPPSGAQADSGTVGGTSTGEMPADLQAWHASIIHRRARGRLLDDIRDTAGTVPRVGKAAAELCRLAFALGRATTAADISRIALDTALRGSGSARGSVLLPARIVEPSSRRDDAAALVPAAAVPDAWPAGGVSAGIVATVLGTDEALLAGGTVGKPPATAATTLTAPIRSQGRAVGLMHLEADERAATPDDLEFVMAVCDALGLAIDNLCTREALSSRLASTNDENERLRRRLGEEARMVGASQALAGIIEQVKRVAATKATVLVRGESGVGKELIARALHDASDRRDGPFVCLNCAALSETLLESELFGHEKGAFTGATERKIGKFEAAHRGTLMLDEIGEMSPAIQAKFLRVLEGHPFERVGGSTRVQVDVRVVAATNRNLEHAVSTGGFRRDLYFRLRVVEILVPPLRQRPEDVEVLAVHFVERFATEVGRRIRGFTPEALASLREYDWPGNIRELRNAIERAVVLAQGEWLDVQDIPLSHLAAPGDSGRGLAVKAGPFVPLTIEEVERRHVLATLEAVGGNKTKAASLLGIERSTLDRKLAKWATQG